MGKMGAIDMMSASPAFGGPSEANGASPCAAAAPPSPAAPKTVLAAVSAAPLGTVTATILSEQMQVAEVFAEANQKKVMNSAWKFTPDYLFYLGRKGIVSDVGGEAVRISFEDANGSSSLWFPSGAVGQFLLPAPPRPPAPHPHEQKLEMLIGRSPPPSLAMALLDVARAYPQVCDYIGSKLVFHNRNICGGFVPPSPHMAGGSPSFNVNSPMFSDLPSSTTSLSTMASTAQDKKSSLAERTRWSNCLSEASLRESGTASALGSGSMWAIPPNGTSPQSVGGATPTRPLVDSLSPFRSNGVPRQKIEDDMVGLRGAAPHVGASLRQRMEPAAPLPRAPTSPEAADSLPSSGIAHINSVLSATEKKPLVNAPGSVKEASAVGEGAEWGEGSLVSQMLEDIFQEGAYESS
eukprot:TRINITY_DN2683_c0_g3_i1.p2 TRINITY_DN2683_c0_g3~~TRINITY_DN2683_c0_g3_i1.p2  ORF type:complete len:408 (+),score=109.19 TRINITY_DN2683_c0_g3_i1:49-1272(+)